MSVSLVALSFRKETIWLDLSWRISNLKKKKNSSGRARSELDCYKGTYEIHFPRREAIDTSRCAHSCIFELRAMRSRQWELFYLGDLWLLSKLQLPPAVVSLGFVRHDLSRCVHACARQSSRERSLGHWAFEAPTRGARSRREREQSAWGCCRARRWRRSQHHLFFRYGLLRALLC